MSQLQRQFDAACQLLRAGRVVEAGSLLSELIAASSEKPELLNAYAAALDMQGRYRDALKYQQEAVRLCPGSAVFRFNLGNILIRCNDIVGAEQQFIAAINCDASLAEAYQGLGHIYLTQGRPESAESCFHKALSSNPDLVDAIYSLGQLAQNQGDAVKAEERYRHCLTQAPAFPPALNGLGMLLMRSNRVAEAEECFNRALAADPDYLQARCNLAVLATWQGNLEYAIAELTELCQLAPADGDIHFNLSLALLTAGMMEEGFREHEWRFHKAAPVAQRYEEIPRWNGESLTGKTLLIHSEQGYGDSIQFARYISLLAKSGATVLVEGQDRNITPLLTAVEGVTAALSRGESLPCQPDFQVPMMSLPYAIGISAWPPPVAPCLHVDPVAVNQWYNKLFAVSGCRIGLAWAGRPEHQNDANRSIPVEKLLRLSSLSGVVWVSLQFGQDRPEVPALSILDLSEYVNDFKDSAALIAALDLVVTVDSAVAHLAGTLGVPVCLLLPWNPDWRWMRDSNSSPWYPSVRIFRQSQPGEWSEPIEALYNYLKSMLGSGGIAA